MATEEEEEPGVSQALIPGLDHETALLCLARVPLSHLKTVRAVCRSWKALLDFSLDCPGEAKGTPVVSSGSEADTRAVQLGDLYRVRRQQGLQAALIFLRTKTSEFVNNWRYFDVTNRVWSEKLPQIPYDSAAAVDARSEGVQNTPDVHPNSVNRVMGFESAAVGPCLFVFGGLTEGGPARGDVFCYDPRKIPGRWSRRASMTTPRCYMASAVVGNLIYVAGGESQLGYNVSPLGPKNSDLLTSAEVDDAETNIWSPLPEMPFAMFSPHAVAIGGEVYVSGEKEDVEAYLGNGSSTRGCVLDLVSNTWREIEGTKKLGDVISRQCTSIGQWLFSFDTMSADNAMTAWNKGTQTWYTIPTKQQSSEAGEGSGGDTRVTEVQDDMEISSSGPGLPFLEAIEDAMRTFLNFNRERSEGASPSLVSQLASYPRLLATVRDILQRSKNLCSRLKSCMWMSPLELAAGSRLIFLHNDGSITSVNADFGGSPGILSNTPAASLSTISSSVQENVQGLGSLHLEHQHEADEVPQPMTETCLAVDLPLADEEPTGLEVVTI